MFINNSNFVVLRHMAPHSAQSHLEMQLNDIIIPYMYKFLKDVNFAVFADILSSTKLNPQNL